MTIKCLTQEEQVSIAEWYNLVKTPISEIAFIYGVSPRTIARVLTEQGVALPLSRRNGESYRVMQILEEHDVKANELSALLILGLQAKRTFEEQYAFIDYQQAEMFEDLPF